MASVARAMNQRATTSAARRRVVHHHNGGGSSPLTEIASTLSHMELTMARAGRPHGARLDGSVHGPSSPSNFNNHAKSHHSSSLGATHGATPTKQLLVGPTDATGAALKPRSRYLQGIVSPSPVAPPHHQHQHHADPYDRPQTQPHYGSSSVDDRSASAGAVQSTMLRRLQEEMRECTFIPNAGRHSKPHAKSAEPASQAATPTNAQGAASSTGRHAAEPSTRAQSAPAPPNDGPSIFDRLYKKPTRHLSRPVAESLQAEGSGTAAAAAGRSPPPSTAGSTAVAKHAPPRPTRQLARCPFGPPSQPIVDKEIASTDAKAKERPHRKVSSRDPVPRIFSRLYGEAALVDEKRRAADRAVQHKQVVSRQHALSIVDRWAALERDREERVENLRRQRAEDEQRYLDAKRREISEHVHRGPAYAATAAAAAAAAQNNNTNAAKNGRPPPRPATSAEDASSRPVAPRHHTHTSMGGDSGMVLTPNGTWRREAPSAAESEGASPVAAEGRSPLLPRSAIPPARPHLGAARPAVGAGNKPAARGAPAVVKPLQLNRLRKAASQR